MQTIKHKNVANENEFEVLWDLPSLPLTENFGNFESIEKYSYCC